MILSGRSAVPPEPVTKSMMAYIRQASCVSSVIKSTVDFQKTTDLGTNMNNGLKSGYPGSDRHIRCCVQNSESFLLVETILRRPMSF